VLDPGAIPMACRRIFGGDDDNDWRLLARLVDSYSRKRVSHTATMAGRLCPSISTVTS
jgi:hypothetical protein